MTVEPVPFLVTLPGRDSLGFEGARSEWHRVHGLLHLHENTLTFEWTQTRHVEQVSLTDVDVYDEATEPELVEVPVGWIAEARLTGGWWAPRLRFRGRRLDAFDGVPGAGQGTLVLRIARRDRVLAGALVDALNAARTLGPAERDRELPPGR